GAVPVGAQAGSHRHGARRTGARDLAGGAARFHRRTPGRLCQSRGYDDAGEPGVPRPRRSLALRRGRPAAAPVLTGHAPAWGSWSGAVWHGVDAPSSGVGAGSGTGAGAATSGGWGWAFGGSLTGSSPSGGGPSGGGVCGARSGLVPGAGPGLSPLSWGSFFLSSWNASSSESSSPNGSSV